VGENLAVGGSTQQQSSDKSGAAGLWAGRSSGRSGGTGHFAGIPAAGRADPAARRTMLQNSRLAAPPGWPGLPPDGPAVDRPVRRTCLFFAGDSTIFCFYT
jgi:hypothetical protein